ncbi:MAG: hypothetical protein KDA53_09035 [Hyphomonas sp.]|nr:hypothetical protein [Hyphomonas sp.]
MSRMQSQETMHRRGGRRPVELTCKVRMGLFKWVEIGVRDVSSGGARLVVPEDLDLPEQFVMKCNLFRTKKVCFRRWQYGSEMGVEFI